MYKQALEIRQRLAKDNPKAYEPDVAGTLNNLALLYSDTQRFTEAEDMYKQALEIYQRLAKDNPKAYEPYVAGTLFNLGALYYVEMNKQGEGKIMFQKALEYYRRLAINTPTAYQQKIELLERILEE